MTSPAPHPIPYQGSKRALAPRILGTVEGRRFETLYEPFAGSAAISIAAARCDLASAFVISDSLAPLADIWSMILEQPNILADEYESIWMEQMDDPPGHYNRVRDEFNSDGSPAKLLYLLARCVKNAPRFNRQGRFNQSPDKRRKGMTPRRMRDAIAGANRLLTGHATVFAVDFELAIASATERDLVYMDPPWQGTTYGTDTRYHAGVPRERIVSALQDLNVRGVPYILSYDGRCGDRTYGEPMPDEIEAVHIELPAGRSSQATLVGRNEQTTESLYVARSIAPRLRTPADPQAQLFAS